MALKVETDEMQEIITDFLIEADELVQSLNANLGKLSASSHDTELLNQIFRAAHTIKGISSFLNFEQVTQLTHEMEEVLNRMRKEELTVSTDVIDVLFFALDTLKQLLDDVRNGTNKLKDITAVYNQLLNFTNPKAGVTEIPSIAYPGEQQEPESVKKVIADQTIRVDIKRLDSLMNLLGELIFARNSLMQAATSVASQTPASVETDTLQNSVRSVNYITNELQTAVMKMRMQPIGRLFGRFPRLVRDLSRDSGKQIDLVLSGEATELDRSIIEEIADPLIHLLRNASHHGIESPEIRVSRGKSPRGTIKLSAAQTGSYLNFCIEDDGNGLNTDAIRQKAIECKLVAKPEAEKLLEQQLFRFILEAGFTTARMVTDISGRGVGMDVVRTNVEKLGGQVEIESKRAIGTSITLRIPLTLAVMQGLLVKAGKETYILPMSSVHEIIRTDTIGLSSLRANRGILLHGEVIHVTDIGYLLNHASGASTFEDTDYIVVVSVAGKKMGLAVDCLLGQEEVVVKPLGNYLGQIDGIAGATILGDGRIRLIIDISGLFGLASKG